MSRRIIHVLSRSHSHATKCYHAVISSYMVIYSYIHIGVIRYTLLKHFILVISLFHKGLALDYLRFHTPTNHADKK